MAYVVLGHASERLDTKKRVPPGCMLILSEECGVQGTFPHTLYSIFSKEEHRTLLTNPVQHKHELETLFKKPITIYTEHEEYPSISYTLFNYSYKNERLQVEPSGVYEVPAKEENWVLHKDKRGLGRYTFQSKTHTNTFNPSELQKIFQGAVFPNIHTTQPMSLQDILGQKDSNVTQAKLFELHPGIYYNFLCRTLPEEEKALQSLLPSNRFQHDPYNRIQAVEDLVRGVKTEKAEEIRKILSRISAARRRSAQPINRLAHLLSNPRLSTEASTLVDTLTEDTINSVDTHDGYTPLMSACAAGHTSVVRKLLKKGANVNVKDYDDVTPLMLACSGPYPTIANLLLDHVADPSATSHDDGTALHIASEKYELRHVLRRMLEQGANPNSKDDEGDTPLHVAASNNMTTNAGYLIRYGADVNATNKEGITPLMEAILESNEQAARLLLRVSDLSIRSPKGTTALGYALKTKLQEIAIHLLESGSPVSNWNTIQDYAKQEGMRRVHAFVKHIMESPGFEKESSVKDRVAMIKCFKGKKEWIQTRKLCRKPCTKERPHRNRRTLRCTKGVAT